MVQKTQPALAGRGHMISEVVVEVVVVEVAVVKVMAVLPDAPFGIDA
jgi:hypothetical protein